MRKVLIPALLLVTQLFGAEKTKLFDLKAMQANQDGTLSDYQNSYVTASAKDFGVSKQTYDFECLTGGKNGVLTIDLKQPLGDFAINYEVYKTHEPDSWVTLTGENKQKFDLRNSLKGGDLKVGFGEYRYGDNQNNRSVSIRHIGDETSLYLDGSHVKTLMTGIGSLSKIEINQECLSDSTKRDQFENFVVIKN